MSLLCLHRCMGHKLLSAVLQAGVQAVAGTLPALLVLYCRLVRLCMVRGALIHSQHWHGTLSACQSHMELHAGSPALLCGLSAVHCSQQSS
jgi:hypothetical protein